VIADFPLAGTHTITDPVTVCKVSGLTTESVGDAVAAGDEIVAEDDVDAVVVEIVVEGDSAVGSADVEGVDSLVLLLESEMRPTTPADSSVVVAADTLELAAYTDEEVIEGVNVAGVDVDVVLRDVITGIAEADKKD
jgi:hypothetical protein